MRLVQHWSNEHLPDHEQFESLRDLMICSPFPMRLERPALPSATPLPARSQAEVLGPATCLTMNAGAATGIRDKGQISRTDVDFICLIETFKSGLFTVNGEVRATDSNKILLIDSNTELVGAEGRQVDFRLWTLPRDFASPLLRRPTDRVSRQIDCQAPIGGLLRAYLDHLAPALGAADPAAGRALVTQLAGLIAIEHGLARDGGDVGRAALASAKLVQAKQLIATYLTDPRLTPPWIATHCGVSLRRLHMLFESTGASVSEFVTAERLDRCYSMLKDPTHWHRSVIDIAQACGFESAATFYRAFRRRFGLRPSELRM